MKACINSTDIQRIDDSKEMYLFYVSCLFSFACLLLCRLLFLLTTFQSPPNLELFSDTLPPALTDAHRRIHTHTDRYTHKYTHFPLYFTSSSYAFLFFPLPAPPPRPPLPASGFLFIPATFLNTGAFFNISGKTINFKWLPLK